MPVAARPRAGALPRLDPGRGNGGPRRLGLIVRAGLRHRDAGTGGRRGGAAAPSASFGSDFGSEVAAPGWGGGVGAPALPGRPAQRPAGARAVPSRRPARPSSRRPRGGAPRVRGRARPSPRPSWRHVPASSAPAAPCGRRARREPGRVRQRVPAWRGRSPRRPGKPAPPGQGRPAAAEARRACGRPSARPAAASAPRARHACVPSAPRARFFFSALALLSLPRGLGRRRGGVPGGRGRPVPSGAGAPERGRWGTRGGGGGGGAGAGVFPCCWSCSLTRAPPSSARHRH